MTTQLNLNEIEKRTFKSTYQDGLLDIQYGLITVFMSIFIYRPESGYSPLNIVMAIGGFGLASLLFWAGKRVITLPRMGMVRFGEIRHRKTRRMSVVLLVFILAQVVLVVFTSMGLFNSQVVPWLDKILGNQRGSHLTVSAIGSLMVGVGMMVMAYFTDFDRGFYISILMSAAVFLMIFLNRPLWPILIGLAILIPGFVLLFRFIARYPLKKEEAND